jgi:L-amino acid N-acyltransferase YncA
MQVRSDTPKDAAAIAGIYNQGIEDRVATFETRPRSADDVHAWLDGEHPVLVVENDHEIIAFASSFAYSARECYAGIAECSVYVRRDMRARGAGRLALETLIRAAEEAGLFSARATREGSKYGCETGATSYEQISIDFSTKSSGEG